MIYQTCRHKSHRCIFFCGHKRINRLDSVVAVSLCIEGKLIQASKEHPRGLSDVACALRSIRLALQMDLPPGVDLHRCVIYTNNKAVVDALNQQVRIWARRGWKTASGSPVVHAEDYRWIASRIDELDAALVFARRHEAWPEYRDLLGAAPDFESDIRAIARSAGGAAPEFAERLLTARSVET